MQLPTFRSLAAIVSEKSTVFTFSIEKHVTKFDLAEKRNFINICKISFNKRYLLYTYICYYPIATFQEAGTCLDAQQSMAKQPIKGCVSNQNRTCGKSVSEKSE